MVGRPPRTPNSRFHRWTVDQRAFMAEIVPGRSHAEISAMVNERFSLDLTYEQIKAAIARYRLHTGRSGQFEKGHVPANKGTHEGGWEPTQFKKGNIPINRVPIGSEKLRSDGYVRVKIADGFKNANWIQKHILVWEESNGPLAPGHVVIFGNGDRTDCRLSNLLSAERADLAVMNKRGLMGHDRESTEAAILISKVVRMATKRKKSQQ